MEGNKFEKYAALLIRRDQLLKEAGILEDEYLREFGDEMYQLYELKVACIELKKKIHFCQAAKNRGEKINAEKMEDVIEEEMKQYYLELEELFASVQGVKTVRTSPQHVVLAVKKKYRELAKMIHPDMHPFTQDDGTLMDLWNRAVNAYHMNDEDELEEIEVLIRFRLEELGYGEDTPIEIEDLDEKIFNLSAEIEEIMNTDPYQYKMLFHRHDLLEEKHTELKNEVDSFTKYQEELEGMLQTFLSDGEVTIVWEMD